MVTDNIRGFELIRRFVRVERLSAKGIRILAILLRDTRAKRCAPGVCLQGGRRVLLGPFAERFPLKAERVRVFACRSS